MKYLAHFQGILYKCYAVWEYPKKKALFLITYN